MKLGEDFISQEIAMRVSFIIPAYNAEKYIERSVRSICKLENSEIQIVVVDDGSKDHTEEKVYELSKQYPGQIKVVKQENAGVSAARNAGVQAADGEYIAFVDADDEVNAENYQLIMNKLPDGYDCIMFGYDIVGNNAFTKYPNIAEGLQGKDVLRKMENMVLDFVVSQNCQTEYLGGKVYQYIIKKDFLIDNNIKFPKEISYAEDMCFVLSLFRALQNIYVMHISAYTYYVNSGSAMHRFNKNFWHNWKKVILYLENNYLDEYDLSKLIVSNGIGSIRHFLEYYKIQNTWQIYKLINEVVNEKCLQESLAKMKNIQFLPEEQMLVNFVERKNTVGLMLYNISFRIKRKLLKK